MTKTSKEFEPNGIIPIDDTHEVYITWAKGSLNEECWAVLCDGKGGYQIGWYYPGKPPRFASVSSNVGFAEGDRQLNAVRKLKAKDGGVFRITQIGTWLMPRAERKAA